MDTDYDIQSVGRWLESLTGVYCCIDVRIHEFENSYSGYGIINSCSHGGVSVSTDSRSIFNFKY